MLYTHNAATGTNVKGQTNQSFIFRCMVVLDLFHNRMQNFLKMKSWFHNDAVSQVGLESTSEESLASTISDWALRFILPLCAFYLSVLTTLISGESIYSIHSIKRPLSKTKNTCKKALVNIDVLCLWKP